jgi:DNA polymerase-3 subunit alpha
VADFTHLHVHSEYSLLDGQSRIARLIEATKAGGMHALALTDHGGMYGSIEFYKACKGAGIKPILGCLLAGQEIITAEGVKNVEDVQVGDYVLTHRGRFRRVTQTLQRAYRGRGYTITLGGRYGRTLTLTEEHPILVRDRSGAVAWQKPGEITAGRPKSWNMGVGEWNAWACLPKLVGEQAYLDVLPLLPGDFSVVGGCLTRTYSSKYRADERWPGFPTRIPLDYDFGYLLGVYAAEGNPNRGGIQFTLHEDEQQVADRIVAIASRWGLTCSVYRIEQQRTLAVHVLGVLLQFIMPALCGKGARQKHVPHQILSGPAAVRDGFVEGILDGEGKDPNSPLNMSGDRRFKTASRSLAWGVRALLVNRGAWVGVATVKEQSALPGGKQRSDGALYYSLSYKPTRTFSDTREDGQAVYRPIASVTPVDLDTQVYNFAVEEDNSYVSDFVLHNCESYLAPNLEERSGRYDYNHLLLLARNNTGYQNLLKLTTIAHTRGYYTRPRVDKRVLAEHAEGLIVTSGCLSGEIPELLLKGDLNGARAAARWYLDVFGPENFYIEVQDHQAPDSPQNKLNPLLYDLHRETGVPLLATNDLHYVAAADADAQDILLCVQTGKTLDDPKRMKFDSTHYYLKTPDEMARLFPELPEALATTMRVAEMCEVEIPFGRNLLPHYVIPPNFKTQDEYLYHLCMEGVKERFGQSSETIQRRIDYEFEIIRSMGFVSYFLIVWDYTNYARQRGMRCVARGSAAGSLVAYVLGITNVDPLRYDLLFERFLNPERKSMPDIDMDFPDDRREEVIRYVADKYGWEQVAQLVTFNTMAAKAAVRDVGRVMGLQNEADRVARLIPAGPRVTIDSAHDAVRELRQVADSSPQIKKLIDLARELEGTVRSTGIHAAGVVISREPLDQTVPLQLRDYKDPKDTWLVCQYEQAHIEELGLLKFDFLGLSNLTILMNCQKFIRQTRGIEIDLERLPTDDAKTYALLGQGETTGVFQLESGAMRKYIAELKPTCIEDITAMVALYRPGPMESIPQFIKAKHGEIQIKYLHPDLEPLLRTSYGVIVYQDQVLLIAVNLAGFTWGEVDKFRKAMSKKIREEMVKYHDKFVQGCMKHGLSEKVAGEIWELIKPFADYGFNRAHAAAYGFVAYQTAYLKANYTAEFMAATLTTEAGDAKKVVAAVDECRRMGVAVLPPDVNRSESGFTVERLTDETTGDAPVTEEGRDQEERSGVRFGLLAIKNVGSRPIEELIEARRSGGSFTSLADLFARTDSKNLTRGAVECLIKAGACDDLGRPADVRPTRWRSRLLHGLDRAMTLGQQQRKNRERGQGSLFTGIEGGSGDDFVPPSGAEHPMPQLLAWEKDLLNLYLSAHPLAHVANALKRRVTTYTAYLNEEWAGQKVTLGGRVTAVRRITTKRGDAMAAVQLEDMQGGIEVVVFPRAFAETSEVWREEAVVLVTGTVKLRDEEPQLVAETVEVFEASEEEVSRPTHLLRITLRRGVDRRSDALAKVDVHDVQSALERFPGEDRFELLVRGGRWVARLVPPVGRPGVRYCPELHSELERILGPRSVEVMVLPAAAAAALAPAAP